PVSSLCRLWIEPHAALLLPHAARRPAVGTTPSHRTGKVGLSCKRTCDLCPEQSAPGHRCTDPMQEPNCWPPQACPCARHPATRRLVEGGLSQSCKRASFPPHGAEPGAGPRVPRTGLAAREGDARRVGRPSLQNEPKVEPSTMTATRAKTGPAMATIIKSR